MTSARVSFRLRIRFACSVGILFGIVVPTGFAVGQDEAIVEPLAAVLAVEDARRFDPALFHSAIRDPSPIVRRHAALAMGRIGDRRAGGLLVDLLTDPDSTVRKDAAFAIGILGDTSALDRLRELAVVTQPATMTGVHAEAVAAAATIGGAEAARLIAEVLNRWVGQATADHIPVTAVRALAEAWRLGEHAPVELLVQYGEVRDTRARRSAVYSLGRLGAPAGATVLIRATDDDDPLTRSYAVRALDAAYADSAGITRTALATRIERLVTDPDPHVRINALRSLATFGGDDHVSAAADRAADEDPNVRVQALIALGEMTGPDAASALRERLDGGIFATRYQALISLANVVGPDALPEIEQRLTDPDWRTRRGAVEALALVGPAAVPNLRRALGDPDARVVAEAVRHLLRTKDGGGNAAALARRSLDHEDPVVRAAALQYFADHPDEGRTEEIFAAFVQGERERDAGLQRAAVRALGALARTDPALTRRMLTRFPEQRDHRVRAAAQSAFPAVAERWGSVRPLETGRSIADYRDLVREIVLPAERGTLRPTVTLETDRGTIVIDLYPAEAPLTVWAFLAFVDRRYFDGNAWHRVVPSFVVQDGDPRGDGRGSSGIVLRDEVSRIPYERGTVGLARAGPDTGSSQFFIALSPQPHLDGAYTVFGQVRSGFDVLDRITLGDRIRRIRR